MFDETPRAILRRFRREHRRSYQPSTARTEPVANPGDHLLLLVLGPMVTFFGSGHLAGFAAVTAELYPTRVRATAQGFTYNVGRVASAAAPWIVGGLTETRGYPAALSLAAAGLALAAVFWIFIPETAGRELE